MTNSKQKVEASNRRLINLGGEYALSKDDAICRQKLNIMFRELSAQLVCLSEQNVELMRKNGKAKIASAQSLDKCAWNAYTKRIKGAGTGADC